MATETLNNLVAKPRVDWVDYAKGICIILVVMMHSTLGVEKAMGETGFLNTFIEWARPFRMPDFFLISGLFLARRIDGTWRDYLDKKVLHFFYFYFLWMTIQFLFKGYAFWQDGGTLGLVQQYLLALIEPFGTLWFIYLLPFFFVVTKLTRRLPAVLIFFVAALLEVAPIHTGWIMIDEFASRFVYFFAGYWLASHVFAFAQGMARLSTVAMFSSLLIWGLAHTEVFRHGFADTPGIALILGFIGTAAVVSAGVLLSRFRLAEAIRYLGENSIVVYLSFFMFMAASRSLALKLVPQWGPDLISLGVTLCGIVGAVVLYWITKGNALRFLFRRPAWVKLPAREREVSKLESTAKVWHSAAHDTATAQPNSRS